MAVDFSNNSNLTSNIKKKIEKYCAIFDKKEKKNEKGYLFGELIINLDDFLEKKSVTKKKSKKKVKVVVVVKVVVRVKVVVVREKVVVRVKVVRVKVVVVKVVRVEVK